MRDAEYISAFLHIVMPIAYQFNPDLVLVSAGFDAAVGDPLGGYKITPTGFAQMLKMMLSLANGNVILALEGGYNLSSISASMAACVSVLLGDPVPALPSIIPKEMLAIYYSKRKQKIYICLFLSACETIKKCISIQKQYWSCLKFDAKLPLVEFVKKINAKKEKQEKEPAVRSEYSLRSRKINSASNIKQAEQQELEVNKLANELNQILSGEYGHAVVPLTSCPHQTQVNPLKQEININAPCVDCNTTKENWFCLVCHQTYCSRYVNIHMLEHFKNTKHSMVLSFSDLSVWCYACDTYVQNELFNEALASASKSKFA